MDEDTQDTHFYLLRTTTTQEDAVVDMLYQKAVMDEDSGVYGVFHPAPIKGYVFMEARDLGDAIQLVQGVPHTKGFVKGEVDFDKEVRPLLQPKSSVLDVKKGDMVELIAGPFKGEKAKVIRVDENKEEVTVELIEATVPIPVTAKGMHIKVFDRVTQETAEVSREKEKIQKKKKGERTSQSPVIGEGPLPALQKGGKESSEPAEAAKEKEEKPKKIVLGAGSEGSEEKKEEKGEEKKEESKDEGADENYDEEKIAEEDANYFSDDDETPEDIIEKKK